MNIILLYLGVFTAIILIAIAVKILKSIVKIAFFISFVLFIFLFITGYFVVNDAKDFKENFPDGQKTFLLTKDENVEAGFVINGSDFDKVEFINKEDLDSLTLEVNANELDIGDNYKIFIADYDMFEEMLNQGVSYEDFEIDKELADEIFSSNDPLTVLAKNADPEDWQSVRESLSKEIGTGTRVKGALFAVMMIDGLSQGPKYVLENLKSGNLEVYPESPLFMALEIIPGSMYERIVSEEENEMEILGKE